ncbi:ATP-binding cassette domain-containing protein [Candidatus Saccharibacteria bacterium]|nr:ATP-binding cassette domain-containing protein [Candidatus Saccharibacteria bacterium]
MEKTVIKVTNLYKSFKLPTERAWGIKQALFNRLRGIKGFKRQKVLRGIDLEIKEGEFIGIVGKNGSGKSTLLKLLAKIYEPDKGSVEVNGRLVPFIELGVGFNPELTGRENIYMNGALLGFSNKEVDKMYKEIVEFAELEEFMDQKLKNYSSGMQVRLAFSIAIRANGDILLLDEVLAVGDEAFQRKCFAYFAKLKKEKKTVILVTHSMDSVQQFCSRAILVNDGKIEADGSPIEISQKYRELNFENGAQLSTEEKALVNQFIEVSGDAKVEKNKVLLNVHLKETAKMDDPAAVIRIYQEDGVMVYRWASDEKLKEPLDLSKKTTIKLELDNILPDGNFTVSVAVKSHDRASDYGTFNNITSFRINPRNAYIYDTFWKIPEKFSIKKGK